MSEPNTGYSTIPRCNSTKGELQELHLSILDVCPACLDFGVRCRVSNHPIDLPTSVSTGKFGETTSCLVWVCNEGFDYDVLSSLMFICTAPVFNLQKALGEILTPLHLRFRTGLQLSLHLGSQLILFTSATIKL